MEGRRAKLHPLIQIVNDKLIQFEVLTDGPISDDISDDISVRYLLEKKRLGLTTKTGLFALSMAIHSSLFLVKVNQMVERVLL